MDPGRSSKASSLANYGHDADLRRDGTEMTMRLLHSTRLQELNAPPPLRLHG